MFTSPPVVETVKLYSISDTDPILQSLRDDYPGFDKWLSKCKREHREAWVIRGSTGDLAGICIFKDENGQVFGMTGKILKLSTLKVSEFSPGNRYGELLFKTAFNFAAQFDFDFVYFTVFEKHQGLIELADSFGFQSLEVRTGLGELVLAKNRRPNDEDRQVLGPLDFHIKYGPPAIKTGVGAATFFVVPIRPEFHSLLFPEAEKQLPLLLPSQDKPFGNSLRKAYLCHAQCRQLAPGDNLLFYRSQDVRSVTALGVVESTLVSREAQTIARYVGNRTVYRFDEIDAMCLEGEVLAILFRLDRLLVPFVGLPELTGNGALRGHPQSIAKLREEGLEWLAQRIE